MTTNPSTIYDSTRKMHLVLSLITALTIVGIYALAGKNGKTLLSDSDGLIYEFIIPVIAIIAIVIGNYLSKRKIKSLDDNSSFADKLLVHKSASLLKWTTVFGSAILSSVAFYSTGRNNLVLYALMIGVLLIYQRPVKQSVVDDLKLSEEEAQHLAKSF
mgnify:CR=1 FL=1